MALFPLDTGLSTSEFERLITLFDSSPHLDARTRAALMANATPTVAYRWLKEEGLLDEQQDTTTPSEASM